MTGVIPLNCIASMSYYEHADIDKADKLNYGIFCQANVRVVMHGPVEVQTLFGTKRLIAIGQSL